MSRFRPSTEPPRSRMRPVRPGPLRAAGAVLLAFVLGVLAAGCSPPSLVTDLERDPGLPLEIDSLVMSPFNTGPRVQINAADLALFDKHLDQELSGRDRFRTFEFAPTRLPNTVRVEGLLHRLQVDERQGEGVYLRTIDLEAELSVLPLEGDEPLMRVRRRVDYQKAYPGPEGVTAIPFDLENAIAEWTAQVVEVLDPSPVSGPIQLEQAMDPDTGEVMAHPALIKGNGYAASHKLKLADKTWHRVLFQPTENGEQVREYRISSQTLNQLRRMGLGEDTLERLKSLSTRDEMPLVPFRRMLREHLNGNVEQEGLILTLSDIQSAVIHLNLAAAHANLATVYRLEKRFDLASYHLARAYAHNPEPARLVRWNALQEARKLNPGSLEPEALISQWLRLPPPATATVQPGPFALSVVPNPAFGAPPAPGAATQGATAQGAAVQGEPAPAAEPQPDATVQTAEPEVPARQEPQETPTPQGEETPGMEPAATPAADTTQ